MIALSVLLALRFFSSDPLESQLKHDLDRVCAVPLLRGAHYGIVVERMDGTILYQRGADNRLTPASNEKLITCAFALHSLGADFRPTTRFWMERNALVVRSTGDPMLSYETLQSLGKRLNPNRKQVWVHEAYRTGYADEWELGDLPYYYAAPVYALTIDRGNLELFNDHGRPVLRPSGFDIRVRWPKRSGPLRYEFDVFHHTLTLHGALPKVSAKLQDLAMPDTDRAAASLLGRGLRLVSSEPSRTPDFVQVGDPLPKTMATCLQISDNNLAENYLMMAASQGKDLPNGYDDALPMLSRFLADTVELAPETAEPADGSGLSRRNVLTPLALAKLLRWSLAQPTGRLWRTMLDHPGSGTLKSRLKGIDFQGKTGSLTKVSAISGYLNEPSGTLIVSIILNQFAGTGSQAKELENLLITKMDEDARNGPSSALQ